MHTLCVMDCLFAADVRAEAVRELLSENRNMYLLCNGLPFCSRCESGSCTRAAV